MSNHVGTMCVINRVNMQPIFVYAILMVDVQDGIPWWTGNGVFGPDQGNTDDTCRVPFRKRGSDELVYMDWSPGQFMASTVEKLLASMSEWFVDTQREIDAA